MATTDEIIVRFTAEGGSTVEEAFRRVGAGAERTSGSTDRAGKSLDGLRLKSDERVARNLGAIAQEFTRGGSAADIMAVSVSRLGESFKGSLIFGTAAFAGLGLFEAITRVGEAIIKFQSRVADFKRPAGNADFLGLDQVNKQLSDASTFLKEIHDEQAKSKTFGGELSGFGRFLVGGGTKEQNEARLADAEATARKAAATALDEITRKTQNLNKIESERLHSSELEANLDAAEVQHKERLGALAATAAAAGLAGTKAAKESLDAENEKYNQIRETIKDKADLEGKALQHASDLAEITLHTRNTEERKLALLGSEIDYYKRLVELATTFEDKAAAGVKLRQAQAALADTERSFDRDVGSGDFIKQLAQQRQEQLQETRGQQIIQELRDAQAHGTPLGLNAQAILNRADKIDSAKGDFSGIASLAGLQFEGLRALDNLSITIK